MDASLACRSIPDKIMCLIFKHGQNEELKSGTRFSGATKLPCTNKHMQKHWKNNHNNSKTLIL